jgi:hypothetical protein
MGVLVFYTILSDSFLVLRRIERDIIKMYIVILVTYPLFLSRINETLNISTDFRKILKYQISLRSVQWELGCCMRTDGQVNNLTDGQT